MLKNVQDILNEFRDYVINEAKKKAPTSSGNLKNGIKGYVKESKNSIQISFEMPDYGFFQDQGVKGVSSGKGNFRFGSGTGQKGGLRKGILEWVKRKNLQFRDRKGRYLSHKSTAYLIVRSIWNKGLKPSLFFTKPFEKAFKKLPDELIEKYGLDMVQLFDEITRENLKK